VRHVHSDTEYTGFELDLTQELEILEAQIPFTLRKYETGITRSTPSRPI